MDFVLVTYNSSKWIEKCFDALMKMIVPNMERINVFVVDNSSSDDTYDKVIKYKNKFDAFSVIQQSENLGFGKANNVGAWKGEDDIICFINVDTEVYPDTLVNLRKEIDNSSDKYAAWEMRQMPYEHPKYYDPLTGETTWMSGAAFAVRRDIYTSIGGFDEHIFMYAEDVDISWRIRAQGYKIKYCPNVVINHYSYANENQVKPVQYLEALKNNLLLRYRYGNLWTILSGHKMYWKVYFFNKEPFAGAKKAMRKKYKEILKEKKQFRKTKINDLSIAKFYGWDYEMIRDGAFVKLNRPKQDIKVSVIVRTCQRPDVLRETLISLRNQTYRNYEVIVVEDGKATAKSMISNEFSDLNIKYYNTGKKMGRSVAGNIGLDKADGQYLNFLDDDDLFFPDHIEVLVNSLQNTDKRASYAFGWETPIRIASQKPYEYDVIGYNGRYKVEFDKLKLCHHNYIPIQCIMFSKELFDKLGGFDVSLDYLEDWDLWVRYLQETDYECVPKTTSIYRVPVNEKEKKSRQDKLDDALEIVREKHKKYYINVSVADVVKLGEEGLWKTVQKKFKFNQ